MIIYYSTITGHVFDIHEGFTARRVPLDPGEAVLLLPDNKDIFIAHASPASEDLLSVTGGNLLRGGISFFSFNEVLAYYRNLLDTLFQADVNGFGLLQLQKIQILRQMHDNGDLITYPQNFYRLDTGALFAVSNLSTLAQVETYLMGVGLTHIDNRLAKYAPIKQAIEAAGTIADLTAIDFFN